MFLYYLYDWRNVVLTPWRWAAEATHTACLGPFVPQALHGVGRTVAAGAELFERMTRAFAKPAFNITATTWRGQPIAVEEVVVVEKPFCRLLHFKRQGGNSDVAEKLSYDPPVLIVAPLSGHHATLLHDMVEAMLPDHDVYVTDWVDAKGVPMARGAFDLEDNISYVMDFVRSIGPRVHVLAVSQSSVPVLCAVSLLAQKNDPSQPASMVLMSGPVDARRAKTMVTEVAAHQPLSWFRDSAISVLPFYYAGAPRRVHPGFLQLQGLLSMGAEQHIGAHFKLFQSLVRGDEQTAAEHRHFYDAYFAVMDLTEEFYLQTLERVFKNFNLAKGTFQWHGQTVKPEAIKKTALLTVEGEMDDISAPGQTRAAHDLCSGLAQNMKQAQLVVGVGHCGLFTGRKWRNKVQPLVGAFIREHGEKQDRRQSAKPIAFDRRDSPKRSAANRPRNTKVAVPDMTT